MLRQDAAAVAVAAADTVIHVHCLCSGTFVTMPG